MRWEPHSDSMDHHQKLMLTLSRRDRALQAFLRKWNVCDFTAVQPELFSSWQTLSNLKPPAWTEQPPTGRWASTAALHVAGGCLPCNRGLWHPGQRLRYQGRCENRCISCNKIPNRQSISCDPDPLYSGYQGLFGAVATHRRRHSFSPSARLPVGKQLYVDCCSVEK